MAQTLEELAKKRAQVKKEAEAIKLTGNSKDVLKEGEELLKETKNEPE